MASPLEISIALHYATRPGDYGKETGDGNFAAQAVQEALERFRIAGLLKHHPDRSSNYSATGGLQVYVDALASVPFPIQRWIMP